MRINSPFINVYKKATTKSEVVTQLLYGETFKIIEKKNKWLKIKNNFDGYLGFIKKKKFYINVKNTHKVISLSAQLYSKPGKKVSDKLSFGSKIKIIKKEKNFYKFDKLWLKKENLKELKYKKKDIFSDFRKFINIKYVWGGKSFKGIDCSGLIQLFFSCNNRFCPRDAKDQIKYFKKKINLKNIKKNDLIFWNGHVAIAISQKKLVHAYGPLKKVLIMPINKTIDRIYKTANLKVIGIRRIK